MMAKYFIKYKFWSDGGIRDNPNQHKEDSAILELDYEDINNKHIESLLAPIIIETYKRYGGFQILHIQLITVA